MPQHLEGTWMSRNSPLRLDFKESSKAPILHFLQLNSDAPDVLDSEWGGRALFRGKQWNGGYRSDCRRVRRCNFPIELDYRRFCLLESSRR